LRCLFGANISITISSLHALPFNRIFNNWQFDNSPPATGFDSPSYVVDQTPPITGFDPDHPHNYVWSDATLGGPKYRLSYPMNQDPMSIINPPISSSLNVFDTTTVKTLMIKGVEANTSQTEIFLGNTELEVASLVSSEVVLKQSSGNDRLANTSILPIITILQATIGGNPNPPQLPIEMIAGATGDFSVNRVTGEITWLTANRPDDNTTYTASYRYRLDQAISIVLKKVKPDYRSIVVIFSNVISGLSPVLVV